MKIKALIVTLILILSFYTTPSQSKGNPLAPQLNWLKCTTCGNKVESSFVDDTIRMGIYDRFEGSADQIPNYHGAAALLPAASQYIISFNYDLYSWDSYKAPTEAGKGYWDSFSVSVSSTPLWQIPLADPITPNSHPGLGFIWGGASWGDHILKHVSNSMTIVVNGNPTGDNYINVFLNTVSEPHSDSLYPSWGTITITSIETDQNLVAISNQAAELAKTVVNGSYLWGGKGWNWVAPKEYVNAQKILSDGYYYYKAETKSIVLGQGLDCSGLILWAYNKSAGSTKYPGYPVYAEGAQGQLDNNTVQISESDLRPGDLLFFSESSNGTAITHVAMYVGGSDPSKNVVEAANTSQGIIFSSKDERKNDSRFRSYGRVKPTQPKLIVQTHSPVTLIVTDPDGLTVNSETYIFTGEEYIRGIPGELYYTTNEQGDDMVYAPELKSGTYTVQVVPKADASPNDTFGLEIIGAAKLIDLAQNMPISKIPTEGYKINATGAEVNIAAQRLFLPVIQQAAAPVATPVPPFEINLSTNSQNKYELQRKETGNGLAIGKLVYSDRNYKYKTVPALLQGATYIQTANNDSVKSDLSLMINVNRTIQIYVAHSDQHVVKPSWLNTFQDTGENLTFIDRENRVVVLSIFKAQFSAGTISLGSNAPPNGGDHSMYTVAIVEAEGMSAASTRR